MYIIYSIGMKASIDIHLLKIQVNGVVRVTRQCGYVPEQDKTRSNKCLKEAYTSFTSSIYCEYISITYDKLICKYSY